MPDPNDCGEWSWVLALQTDSLASEIKDVRVFAGGAGYFDLVLAFLSALPDALYVVDVAWIFRIESWREGVHLYAVVPGFTNWFVAPLAEYLVSN